MTCTDALYNKCINDACMTTGAVWQLLEMCIFTFVMFCQWTVDHVTIDCIGLWFRSRKNRSSFHVGQTLHDIALTCLWHVRDMCSPDRFCDCGYTHRIDCKFVMDGYATSLFTKNSLKSTLLSLINDAVCLWLLGVSRANSLSWVLTLLMYVWSNPIFDINKCTFHGAHTLHDIALTFPS